MEKGHASVWERLAEAALVLRPEQERLAMRYAKEVARAVGQAGAEGRVLDVLRRMIVDSERAEGEPTGDVREGSGMSYDDAVEAEVSREEARREVAKHHGDWNEFVRDVGDRPKYLGKEVLDWLGY